MLANISYITFQLKKYNQEMQPTSKILLLK